jgi:hypothetical protein
MAAKDCPLLGEIFRDEADLLRCYEAKIANHVAAAFAALMNVSRRARM